MRDFSRFSDHIIENFEFLRYEYQSNKFSDLHPLENSILMIANRRAFEFLDESTKETASLFEKNCYWST
jgi:hypothetical protein